MGTGETKPHPIDFEVHPVGGWFFVVWGVLMCIGPVLRGPSADVTRFAAESLMGLGVLLLGVAMLLPPGRSRRLAVGTWVVSIAAWIAVLVYGFVA